MEGYKMAKAPKSIHIGGVDYELIFPNHNALEGENKGLICFSSQKIYISKEEGITTTAQKETSLHEVIHAVETTSGQELTENQVVALSYGLFAVLKDNPDWVKWLLSD
jgi:hypothetical protein